MADERDRWLDRAAADRLLRGEPPLGPDADPRDRAAAARLRTALDALTPPMAPGRELPGEAAALAAFRKAHGVARPGTSPTERADADPTAERDVLVDLVPAPPVRVRVPAPRRRAAPVRLGLAAALASVAVGGLAATVGTGLLDRPAHEAAGPLPSVSVGVDSDPTASGDLVGPSPTAPQPRPTTPMRDGGGATAGSPGVSATPDGGSRMTPETVGGPTAGPIATSSGPVGTDDTAQERPDEKGFGNSTPAGGGKDRERESRVRAARDLCEEYRMGHIVGERRDHLIRLAKNRANIARFCEALLDGPEGTKSGPGSNDGSTVPQSPTLNPGGALGFRTKS
ncbi:hypothetical protein ADK55_29405 [Streptomyces sp. WM4235]|uniref:hypothetical protein n=1 Tax=unclassified Streptomyces TaxID=2593676 RepID=UPI0006AF8DE3|nr:MULTISPECIES: hypothetical protein [unclassified Streptomyces]KOU41227.1 hypothetical protein ADK55_29405 [Streptomyces sp. WM4235]MCX5073749.1 hypothetical protein [Streptomyces sp. NBC_00424]WUD43024.1 hypothetical protein OHA84_22310 [Streptomyces sp. NBC_00513]